MREIIKITSFEDKRLDVYARLTENQLVCREHPERGLFIAESPNVIERALRAGYEPVSILTEEKLAEKESARIIEMCGDIPVFAAPMNELIKLTGFALTRGLLCAMRRKPLLSPAEVCRSAKRIAVLEDVMNPTNVGAIFRSAAALGMDAVLLTGGCSDPFYRRCARVSMGTVFQIPWTFIPNETGSDMHSLFKELGFRSAAFALESNSVSIDNKTLNSEERLAIVLGNEGFGLKPETIKSCDYTVMIPMSHGVDSLNVAAASAVAFWQLGRR